MRIGRQRGLAVIAVKAPSVLVEDVAPVGEWAVGGIPSSSSGSIRLGATVQRCVQSSPRSKV
jgi:hypothetical protein